MHVNYSLLPHKSTTRTPPQTNVISNELSVILRIIRSQYNNNIKLFLGGNQDINMIRVKMIRKTTGFFKYMFQINVPKNYPNEPLRVEPIVFDRELTVNFDPRQFKYFKLKPMLDALLRFCMSQTKTSNSTSSSQLKLVTVAGQTKSERKHLQKILNKAVTSIRHKIIRSPTYYCEQTFISGTSPVELLDQNEDPLGVDTESSPSASLDGDDTDTSDTSYTASIMASTCPIITTPSRTLTSASTSNKRGRTKKLPTLNNKITVVNTKCNLCIFNVKDNLIPQPTNVLLSLYSLTLPHRYLSTTNTFIKLLPSSYWALKLHLGVLHDTPIPTTNNFNIRHKSLVLSTPTHIIPLSININLSLLDQLFLVTQMHSPITDIYLQELFYTQYYYYPIDDNSGESSSIHLHLIPNHPTVDHCIYRCSMSPAVLLSSYTPSASKLDLLNDRHALFKLMSSPPQNITSTTKLIPQLIKYHDKSALLDFTLRLDLSKPSHRNITDHLTPCIHSSQSIQVVRASHKDLFILELPPSQSNNLRLRKIKTNSQLIQLINQRDQMSLQSQSLVNCMLTANRLDIVNIFYLSVINYLLHSKLKHHILQLFACPIEITSCSLHPYLLQSLNFFASV